MKSIYKFDKDEISLYSCKDMKEIEKNIEDIFKKEQKTLPKNKTAKILIKPNFNNDLNSMTGNSTDLRVIVGILKSLKKRGYKDITIADGPNCGINHVGIDVFSRLCIDKIAKQYKVKLKNLNHEPGTFVELTSGRAEIARICIDSDFIINVPKLKTHVEAKITISCKNYIGCFKGTQKRKIHNNLPANIIRIAEIIKTGLIIVDGLIGMEGRGPGDGIPKKVGIILAGHNPFLMDFLCSKLMGLDYKGIPFLKIAIDKKHILDKDIEKLGKIEKIAKFKPANKTFFDKILLNNFFIGLRFSKYFEKFFNKGPLPWILFKMKVKQDKYVNYDPHVERIYSENKEKTKEDMVKKCLETYCPMGCNRFDKKCIKCMYCYQMLPDLIKIQGDLGSFKMQLERFGKYIKWTP